MVSLRVLGLDEEEVAAGIAVDPETEPYSGGPIGEVFAQLRASPPRQTPFALVDGDRVVGFIVAREGARAEEGLGVLGDDQQGAVTSLVQVICQRENVCLQRRRPKENPHLVTTCVSACCSRPAKCPNSSPSTSQRTRENLQTVTKACLYTRYRHMSTCRPFRPGFELRAGEGPLPGA